MHWAGPQLGSIGQPSPTARFYRSTFAYGLPAINTPGLHGLDPVKTHHRAGRSSGQRTSKARRRRCCRPCRRRSGGSLRRRSPATGCSASSRASVSGCPSRSPPSSPPPIPLSSAASSPPPPSPPPPRRASPAPSPSPPPPSTRTTHSTAAWWRPWRRPSAWRARAPPPATRRCSSASSAPLISPPPASILKWKLKRRYSGRADPWWLLRLSLGTRTPRSSATRLEPPSTSCLWRACEKLHGTWMTECLFTQQLLCSIYMCIYSKSIYASFKFSKKSICLIHKHR